MPMADADLETIIVKSEGAHTLQHRIALVRVHRRAPVRSVNERSSIVGRARVLFPSSFVHLRSRTRAAGTVDNDLILVVLNDLMTGVRALHLRSIVHRDIKPPNVLVKNRRGPGLSRVLACGAVGHV